MSDRHKISPEEAEALAKEEQGRRSKLDDAGLCVDCGDMPQNPYVDMPLCLSCYMSIDQEVCDVRGCPNKEVGHFRQLVLCEAHLAEKLADEYLKYLSDKSTLNEKKGVLEMKKAEYDFDPSNVATDPDKLSDVEEKMFNNQQTINVMESELHHLEKDIKDAMQHLDQPFPENYVVFG